MFQFSIPDTHFHDDKLEVIQYATDYNYFKEIAGGDLGYDDYIKAILFNKNGFVDFEYPENLIVTKSYVRRIGADIKIELSFKFSGDVEQVGEHRIWMR